MWLRPFQFTIRQLVFVIGGLAFFCAVNRSSTAPFFGALIFACTLFSKRPKPETGLWGCAIALFFMLVVIVIATIVEAHLPGKIDGLGQEVTWLLQFALGFLFGAMVSSAFHSILRLTKRYIDRRPLSPPPDNTCGPIAWRRLDGA
jgi:hypothetical protein